MRVARTIAAAVLVLGCVQSTEHTEPAVSSGSRRMAVRLAAIADSANPWASPYLNRERVEQMLARESSDNPAEQIPREYQLANQLVRAGRPAEAVQRLDRLIATYGDQAAERLRPLLALALLRSGEQDNCIALHSSDTCLLPIGDRGVYTEQENTRRAIEELEKLLVATPDDLTSRWLLNVASMAVGEYPDAVPPRWLIPVSAFASEYEVGRFRDVAPQAGVDALGLAGGSITEDFDGDGDLDIVASSAGLRDPLRYFRNDGDGRFTERTEAAGLTGIVGGLNVVHADYDNDGNADLLVLRGAWLGVEPATDGGRHPNSLLRNLGGGRFADVTEEAGLLGFHPTQTAGWADYDNDGWLDLYIGNESVEQEVHPSELFHNNGDGTFTEVAAELGVAAVGLVKAVTWGDYDNDGLADLYVSRLGQPNLLFRNSGPNDNAGPGAGDYRPFVEVGEAAGVREPLASFPTWFWDYDNDGQLDLFVSGYAKGRGSQAGDVAAEYLGLPTRAEKPRLYRNRGDGTFEDVTTRTRLDRVAFTMGCNFGDVDNDGFLDLYLGTGDPDLRALVPNRMFRNDGGRRFLDVTTAANVGHLQKGHGIAFADIDNDGDQDIYAGLGGFFSGDVFQNALFENPGHGNRWITLELAGTHSNRAALGARVTVNFVEAGESRTVHARVSSGGSFGGSSFRQEIGLGRAERIDEIVIFWPASGKRQRFAGLEPEASYLIREDSDEPIRVERKRFRLGGA